MKSSVSKDIKRIILFMSVFMLVAAGTSFVHAQNEAEVVGVVNTEADSLLSEEAEFEDEDVPLDSVPDDNGNKVAVTPYNILSAIGSYSLLIPALIIAAVAWIVAAIYRRKDKSETAKQ